MPSSRLLVAEAAEATKTSSSATVPVADTVVRLRGHRMKRREVVLALLTTPMWKSWGVDATRTEDATVRLREAEEALNQQDVITAEDRARHSTNAARAALELEAYQVAERHALNALDALEHSQRDWNYGNVVHHAHLVLGHLALIQGDTKGAIKQLALAGQTPGSPQLDTFGPNMSLALALLERGEREIVLEYLDRCGKFWTKRDLLSRWTADIKAGRVPDFGPNLRY